MSRRIVIVGGVAAGASAAAKARRTSEEVQIVLVEAGPYVSFANCGLPYYLGGEIASRSSLFVAAPEMLRRRFRVDVRTGTLVTALDRRRRAVALRGPDGAESDLSYDRLILATGAAAIKPPIEGLERGNVFTVRTVPDVDAISELLSRSGAGEPPRAVIIGGGYVGLETAEQLSRRGLRVTVIEMAPQLMPGALDAEMAAPLAGALAEAGVEVVLGDGVERIVEQGPAAAVTRSGRSFPFDLGILSVGVRPNVGLARAAGIELGPTGAVAVDALGRTSDPAVYAAGDNSESRHLVVGRPVNIPLAGPANKGGRIAGANAALDLVGAADDDPRRLRLRGVLGTAVVRVCGQVAAVTGLTERQAAKEKVPWRVSYLPGSGHAGYYPGAGRLLLKVLYDPDTGRLLGAQCVGSEGVDKRIDVLATAISAGMTVEDLEGLDLCYAPPFGSAKDPVNLAGFAAANARRGVMPAITPAELLDLLAGDDPPVVLDVRTAGEYSAGHLDGAINLPADELRDRLDEVPADRPVAVHCAAGYRSYVAQRILLNLGRAKVSNVLGGWGLIRQVQASRQAGRVEA